ncbi:DUF2947 family protein [Undibacterium sp. Ji83W]|uniref:DUF2947 family protein n=1 Tax=Undibacterium sp. Ji83W TaxID=3413043 RepID=UPI003BF25A7E
MNSALYRQVTAKKDWPFFDEDCTMSASDKEQILVLGKEVARAFWEKHVSPQANERHPMLLPTDHWLRPDIPGPDWLNDSKPAIATKTAEVATFLNQHFKLDADRRIYFVLAKDSIYMTSMGIFTRHWADFLLLDDECPFLFHPGTKAFACFGPHGQPGFGAGK